MTKPTWLNIYDLSLHILGDALLTAALTALGTPVLGSLLSCLACGVLREYGELDAQGRPWSDFRMVAGGWANGGSDVAAWLLGVPVGVLLVRVLP